MGREFQGSFQGSGVSEEVIADIRKLAVLIVQERSMVSIMEQLRDQGVCPETATAIDAIIPSLKDGQTFTRSFRVAAGSWGSVLVGTVVTAGEVGGTFGTLFDKLADYLDFENALMGLENLSEAMERKRDLAHWLNLIWLVLEIGCPFRLSLERIAQLFGGELHDATLGIKKGMDDDYPLCRMIEKYSNLFGERICRTFRDEMGDFTYNQAYKDLADDLYEEIVSQT